MPTLNNPAPQDHFASPPDFGTIEGLESCRHGTGDAASCDAAFLQFVVSMHIRKLGRGWPVEQLAESSGMRRQDWWARLRGETWMTVPDLARIDLLFKTQILNDPSQIAPDREPYRLPTLYEKRRRERMELKWRPLLL